ALQSIDTELNICIDSDDYMPDNAVEIILNFWKNNGGPDFAGIIGLDKYENGKLIGNKFPADLKTSGFAVLFERHKIKRDKKTENRADLRKKYFPFPKVNSDRLPDLSYLDLVINQEKKY